METPRLRFRRLRADDYALVAPILQDPQTMRAWGHAFSYDEICGWIARMLEHYQKFGYGCFAGVHRQTGALATLAGPLPEKQRENVRLLYIVRRELWQKGYGMESARAALQYAFDNLNAARALALIRPNNLGAFHIAANLGMKPVAKTTLWIDEREELHIVCAVDQPISSEI